MMMLLLLVASDAAAAAVVVVVVGGGGSVCKPWRWCCFAIRVYGCCVVFAFLVLGMGVGLLSNWAS